MAGGHRQQKWRVGKSRLCCRCHRCCRQLQSRLSSVPPPLSSRTRSGDRNLFCVQHRRMFLCPFCVDVLLDRIMLDTETCFRVGHRNTFPCPCCVVLMSCWIGDHLRLGNLFLCCTQKKTCPCPCCGVLMSCWIRDHVRHGNLFPCWMQKNISVSMLRGVDVLLDKCETTPPSLTLDPPTLAATAIAGAQTTINNQLKAAAATATEMAMMTATAMRMKPKATAAAAAASAAAAGGSLATVQQRRRRQLSGSAGAAASLAAAVAA